jgi:iron complex outermembrane recepter protein
MVSRLEIHPLAGRPPLRAVSALDTPSIDQTFRSKWLTDVELSYKLRHGLRIAGGSNNVFDVYPDKNRPEISFNDIFVYPRRTAPFGFNGGFYYTRLS